MSKDIITADQAQSINDKMIEYNKQFRNGESSIDDDEYDYNIALLELYKNGGGKLKNDVTLIMDDAGRYELPVRMYSMSDIFTIEELVKWMERLKLTYYAEPKYDGASMSVKVRNSKIVTLATRGDGVLGTKLSGTLVSMIKNLYPVDGNAIIHGEVVVSKKDFLAANVERVKEGKKPYSNPRSMVSGLLGESTITDKHNRLHFIPYSVFGPAINNNADRNKFLIENGYSFPTLEKGLGITTNSIRAITDYIDRFNKERDGFPFSTDGVVISVDTYSERKKLGHTGKYPNFMMAYKYKAKTYNTVITNVEFQIGRTKFTPVAHLKPVEIDGTIVTRATLNNMQFIKDRSICINDVAVIIKSGEIIPKIILTIEMGGSTLITPPTNCYCGTPLIQEGVDYKCPNPTCKFKFTKLVEYHVSRDLMDIRDFGPKVAETLVNDGLNKLSDIYKLKLDYLASLFGVKNGTKIYNNIQGVLGKERYLVLASMGIRRVGRTSSRKILDVVDGDIERVFDVELQLTREVGTETTKALYDFLNNNMELVKELFNVTKSTYTKKVTYDTTVCITGKHNISRKQLEKVLNRQGVELVKSVSKNTNYLIANTKGGTKYKKAIDLGVPVVTLEELLEKINKG